MRRTELITAGLLIVLGLLTIVVIIPRYVAVVAGDGLSPAFMPYIAAILATTAMVILTVRRWRMPASEDTPAPFTWQSARFCFYVVCAFGGSFVLLSTVGYLAGAAVLAASASMLARATPRLVAVSAVAFPLVLWTLFTYLLDTPLP